MRVGSTTPHPPHDHKYRSVCFWMFSGFCIQGAILSLSNSIDRKTCSLCAVVGRGCTDDICAGEGWAVPQLSRNFRRGGSNPSVPSYHEAHPEDYRSSLECYALKNVNLKKRSFSFAFPCSSENQKLMKNESPRK